VVFFFLPYFFAASLANEIERISKFSNRRISMKKPLMKVSVSKKSKRPQRAALRSIASMIFSNFPAWAGPAARVTVPFLISGATTCTRVRLSWNRFAAEEIVAAAQRTLGEGGLEDRRERNENPFLRFRLIE